MKHTFSVYAPTTPLISCRCSAWGDEPRAMIRGDDGTWTLEADLPEGTHVYTYHLKSLSWFAKGQEVDVADPLARFLDEKQGATVVVIPPPIGADEYAWKHDAQEHPSHDRLAIYEVYVQDVSEAGGGTFNSVVARLEHIAHMGFTAIELMPITTSDTGKGWGYTPAFFYSVEPRFGSEIELCRLVDEAHGHGMAVFLDGVYNHASKDCPLAHIDHDCYFHHDPKDPGTAWGPQFNYGLNLLGTTEFPARHFIKQKIAHWIQLFHVDGIRYDAVSQIRDRHFLGEMTSWAREIAGAKPFFAVAECLPVERELVGPNGPMDACWRDSFSHGVRRLLSGTWDGDEIERCIDCRKDGFLSGKDVVNFLASHDTGYTARHLLDAGLDEDATLYRMRLGLVLLFTAVGLPMVWMGDEFGCATPCNQEPHPLPWSLIEADPRRAALVSLTRTLLHLRRDHAALRGDDCTILARNDLDGVLIFHRWDGSGGRVLVAFHGAGGDVACRIKAPTGGRWFEHTTGGDQEPDAQGELLFTFGGWQAQVWTQNAPVNA